ncbi:MAG: efflux RND transporter permease subunit, partial [Candidatus Cloacimonadota bacterium]
LFLFLHDLRSTLIVALAMPISIVSTFVFLKASGFTINVMTLMGLSTSVGILVANSVVVLENIFRHKDMGNDRVEASDKGTSEIAVAVFASTLTNIVVFLPIATMTSMVGQFFKEFGLTVTYATIFSLISSFTIVPMLASRILPQKKIDTLYGRKFEIGFGKVSAWYSRLLSKLISTKKRGLALVGAVLILFVLSFFLVPFLGFELMPTIDQGNLTVTVELPQGYNLQQTAQTIETVNARLAKHKEVEHIVTNLGASGYIDKSTNIASADVKLVHSSQRKLSTTQMISVLSKDLADIPNARVMVKTQGGFGGGEGIEFFLQGQDNDKLEELKSSVLDAIKDTPGIMNLDTSTRPGRAEITIVPKRDRMAESGAMVYDLAMAIRTAIEGTVSTRYREQGNEYDIRVSMEESSLDSPEKLGNLPIAIYGQTYLLSQLADVTFSPGINKITHQDRFKSIQFTAGIAEGFTMGKVNQDINKRLDTLQLPSGYQISWGGEAEMMNETMVDMMRTFMLAILLTYMLLAAVLESFVQPILIMATVPLSLIGVFIALFLTGLSINIFSMMAVIMLVGIVVNNAILILDYANLKLKEGMGIKEAILEAGEQKLKPIIMSTLAIVIGMLPMALGVGEAGKEFRQSMGMVSIGGLVASTFLTLVIIPVLYYITHRSKKSLTQ